MQGSKKIPIGDLNQHITCKICRGYFIDATTIIECLHTFCRSCIVKYLEKNKYCPICDVQVHKTKPLLNIRSDKIIQDLVYKLVPRLFQNEMQKRKDFYLNHPDAKPSSLEQCEEANYKHLLTPEETICLTLNYQGSNDKPRYLQCPAAVSLGHLKKLIRAKYDLSEYHRIEIMYNQDCLNSSLTLMDVAYIYMWKRKGPIDLTYRIYECVKKSHVEFPQNTQVNLNDNNINNNNSNSNHNNNWKEVQLRISENGEMSITGIQDAGLDSSLLEFVNNESKNYKNDTEADRMKIDVIEGDEKKVAQDVNYIVKENSTKQEQKEIIKKEETKLSIISNRIPFSVAQVSNQTPQIIDMPIQSSLTSCASLSSATTTIVFSTINNSKCSTKTEDSVYKIEPMEKATVDRNSHDTSLKRKKDSDGEDVIEPPLKQQKSTIVNNPTGIVNLSNNHPLKKHSKMMNRRIENIKESFSKVVILDNALITSADDKQNFINKNGNIGNKIETLTPNSTSKSVMSIKQSTIPSKSPTTSNYIPCYTTSKNVYNKTINIPSVIKPVTTCGSIPKNECNLQSGSQVSTEVSNTIENKPINMTCTLPQQQINNKFVIKSKPSTPIGYKTLRDPPKSWNSQISKANLSNKTTPEQKYNDVKNVKPKFFKVRNNMPRYLGNPSSGVKPMYQVHVSPEKERQQELSNKMEKSEIKKHSIVKIDPKTLKPISEKAPETTSLSNHSGSNHSATSQGVNVCSSPIQTDLKINTSSVPIFNPLKLQSSPKSERKSPKSPHSPKLKSNNSPTGNKREKVNLTFTPPNPFVPRLASPTCPLGPSQFLYPSPYDPRVMAAAYTSLWYGQRMAQAGFPGTVGFPGTSTSNIALDLNQQQRKSFEMMAAAAATAAAAVTAHHDAQLSSKTLSNTTSTNMLSKCRTTVLSKQSSIKRSSKDTRNEKSLENAVEKLTQNKNKEADCRIEVTPEMTEKEIKEEEHKLDCEKKQKEVDSESSKSNELYPVSEKKKLITEKCTEKAKNIFNSLSEEKSLNNFNVQGNREILTETPLENKNKNLNTQISCSNEIQKKQENTSSINKDVNLNQSDESTVIVTQTTITVATTTTAAATSTTTTTTTTVEKSLNSPSEKCDVVVQDKNQNESDSKPVQNEDKSNSVNVNVDKVEIKRSNLIKSEIVNNNFSEGKNNNSELDEKKDE